MSKRKVDPDAAKRARRVARGIVRRGKSILAAMTGAGFSEKQARKGMSEIVRRPAMRKALKNEIGRLMAEVQDLPGPNERQGIVRWRLMKNVLEGKDKAVQSCKLAGMDREIDMFTPENRTGIIIVTPPASVDPSVLDIKESSQPSVCGILHGGATE